MEFPDWDYVSGALFFGGFGQMAKGESSWQLTGGSRQLAEKSQMTGGIAKNYFLSIK